MPLLEAECYEGVQASRGCAFGRLASAGMQHSTSIWVRLLACPLTSTVASCLSWQGKHGCLEPLPCRLVWRRHWCSAPSPLGPTPPPLAVRLPPRQPPRAAAKLACSLSPRPSCGLAVLPAQSSPAAAPAAAAAAARRWRNGRRHEPACLQATACARRAPRSLCNSLPWLAGGSPAAASHTYI